MISPMRRAHSPSSLMLGARSKLTCIEKHYISVTSNNASVESDVATCNTAGVNEQVFSICIQVILIDSNITYEASIAQWQSTGLVNQGS